MKTTLKLATAAAVCALFIACNTDKVPAEAAITAAEKAIGSVSGEAQKFAPDQLKATNDALAAAKDQFAKGDYKGALASASALTTKAKELKAAAVAKKDELTKAWTDASADLPKALADLKSRVETLSAGKKLPKGIDAAKLTQAKDGLAASTKTFEEGAAAFAAGNIAEATQKVSGLKAKLSELGTLVGMQAPAAPAAAAAKK
jgi:hypothetical protein